MDLGGAKMKVYAGIDLHSSNNYVGIIDEQDQRLYQKRLQNQIEHILPALELFKESLEGVVVESSNMRGLNTQMIKGIFLIECF